MTDFDYEREFARSESARRLDELAFQFLKECTDDYPPETLPIIKERVKRLKDYQIESLILTPTNKPWLALVLSILAGSLGIDRFYAGDIGLGILKLCTFGGFGIWTIIDYFFIMRRVRRRNLEALMPRLDAFERENTL